MCIALAGATHTSALEWFDTPIVDLEEWIEAAKRVQKAQEKANGKYTGGRV